MPNVPHGPPCRRLIGFSPSSLTRLRQPLRNNLNLPDIPHPACGHLLPLPWAKDRLRWRGTAAADQLGRHAGAEGGGELGEHGVELDGSGQLLQSVVNGADADTLAAGVGFNIKAGAGLAEAEQ